MKRLTLIYSFIITACIYGCTPTTNLTASWTKEHFPSEAYEKVFVTALIQDDQYKLNVEEELATSLRREGVKVDISSNLFPDNFDEKMPSKEDIMDQIEEKKYDAILTISFIDSETDRQYVSTGYAYDPVNSHGWYGDFYGYYSNVYPLAYDPGYWTLEKTYFMETNLYDAESEELVWSAQSETYDPENLETLSESFAGVVVDELEDDDFIPAR